MKHYMLPKSTMAREAHPSSELLASPNPSSQKQRSGSNRKQRGFSKENCDPNSLPPDSSNSGSPFAPLKPSMAAAKMKSPLPPRPPLPSGNPLKRKLNLDAAAEAGLASSSDSEVKVVVRMRPPRKDEEESEMIVQKVGSDSLTINEKTFTFDSVADTDSTQMDIFEQVGAPLVENCLAGFNSSVFAYGQTGSGKTYTMWGLANALLAENPLNDQQGLTPRILERLFARIDEEQSKHADKQLKYLCRCSFLEIYNEQITDLLNPSQRNLQIREDVKSGVYVENLTEECVSSLKDVLQLLSKGLSNRRIGSTSINAESSRSHSVFTCVVESRFKVVSDGLSSCKTSRINLVDLAGSERQKLTGAAGERLKEAGNINRSLSMLGNLINILAEVSQTGKPRHIPYRDSKLTFLLQESLGGNARLAMICAISPAQSCKSETFSTLRFAQRAKAIKNKAVVNEVMQDDVNVLREVIRQLKEELLRMKANGNQNNPSGAYSNGWNARRSLNLLKFSLNRPIALSNLDDDGDELMDIDDEAVDKLCIEAGLDPVSARMTNGTDANNSLLSESEPKFDDIIEQNCHVTPLNASDSKSLVNEVSDLSDMILEEGILETDEKKESSVETMEVSGCSLHDKTASDDVNTIPLVDSAKEVTVGVPVTNPPSSSYNGSTDSETPHYLSIIPFTGPILQSPAPSLSPRVSSSGRKSLRTSSMLTASQKDLGSDGNLVQGDMNPLAQNPSKKSHAKSPTSTSVRNSLSTTEHLAASLHHGMEIIDSHMQHSPLRRSPFRYSFQPAERKQNFFVQKADIGVQTQPDDAELSDEDRALRLCSNCKNTIPLRVSQGADGDSNLQLVPVDDSLSAEKSKALVPKAVERVLAGAIRREMALEEFCSHQNSEIMQLKRLVQQYKHERECNAIIGQIRDDKIVRLENLMDGVLPKEEFMEEEFLTLKKEHELLKERYENHPEVLSSEIELRSIQNELERYKNFFDLGERDILLEEIQDLRTQLSFYADSSRKTERGSNLQLTYPSEPCLESSLSTISEGTEVNIEEKHEQERIRWAELESKWITIAEELRAELGKSHSTTKMLKSELESEKKCSEELKEALQLAMEGHARMLEQYAELEERHMQMLARQRSMQEGIEDIKKAAARAGVRGAESRFINSLAREIMALRVEKEKEMRYLRDENKAMQAQLNDTAEAVQAAGELLVRLKEAEEAVAAAQRRAAEAEQETEKVSKQMEKLKKKYEKEASTQIHSHLPKETPKDSYSDINMLKFDTEERHSADENNWKDEFKVFFDNHDTEDASKLDEPSSWFTGYDRCNI